MAFGTPFFLTKPEYAMRSFEYVEVKPGACKHCYRVHPNRRYDSVKRVFDFFASIVLLLSFSPILILTFILIKLTSRGPAIFKQKRIGWKGRLFTIYKFRSLKIMDTGDKQIGSLPANHFKWKLVFDGSDPRITPVGSFIRKTSIDELPQLINVLKGDMSLVGPRPLMPVMLDPYKEFNSARSVIRPGISGLWQVKHRDHKNIVDKMIHDDLEYIRKYNFILDLSILLKTIPVVISRKGAF